MAIGAQHWTDNDTGYEKWLLEHPEGFVANLNRQPTARYFRIHRATHKLPDRSNPGSINPRTGNNYSKLTANHVHELLAWAKERIPALVLSDANYCKTCNPYSNSFVESAPTADASVYVRRADKILAHGPVSRPAGTLSPEVEYSTSAQYYRDPKVRAWVLQRASGYCELCNMPAPFVTENDDLYLESHHLILLAEGGSDTPINTAALCPNCHRRMHYSKDRREIQDKLSQRIIEKEGAYAP